MQAQVKVRRAEKIFDLGFFNGDDTTTYLNLGYEVVACEGSPTLFQTGKKAFDEYISAGRLHLLNQVVADYVGVSPFYVNDRVPEWSTASTRMAKSGCAKAEPIRVPAVTIETLIKRYGTPLYIKCDIEGNDNFVARGLATLQTLPRYVSFELSKENYLDIFASLKAAGYTKFQLINQLNSARTTYTPIGCGEQVRCGEYSSGLFGKFLPDRWEDLDETLSRYLMFRSLRQKDPDNLALGWLDVHAKHDD